MASTSVKIKVIKPPKLTKFRGQFHDNVDKGLWKAGQLFEGNVKEGWLSGRVTKFGGGDEGLNVRTGRLRASITTSRPQNRGGYRFVKVGTNVVYAPVHEFGGTITRKSGKSFEMPERPFMRPALEYSRPKMIYILRAEMMKPLGGV